MEEIVLYSTNCPKCAILEGKLREKSIEFAVNTDVDEMLKLGMQSAPALKINDELLGFVDAVKWVNEL